MKGQDIADFMRHERVLHEAAIKRIDAWLEGRGPELPPRTPAAIVAVLRAAGKATSPATIAVTFERYGRDVSYAAITKALERLVARGDEVRRVGAGLYEAVRT